ncbi:MAG TPA: ABC transporter permease [Steroidobacteraceae bacterium]|jgi:peptide/nickel transport system permease protein|nr:ABC transporter permease [Steroidobacteraceae bacterium]
MSHGVWRQAGQRLWHDRIGMGALLVVGVFGIMVVLVSLHLLAADWAVERGEHYANPTFLGPGPDDLALIEPPAGRLLDLTAVDPLAPHYADIERRTRALQTTLKPRLKTLTFGGDRYGRDVLKKAIKGSQVSIVVGLAAALVATFIGSLLGAFAGFCGGLIGDALEWLYNVFTSVPYILLIFAFAAVSGRGIVSVIVILGLTGWTGVYRLIRAEYLKHSTREYVRAAEAIGAPPLARMFGHILPNVSHVILVQLSLNVVSFIKAEVILSFLGLGVSVDSVSWGTMLNEAQSELILGKWWQLTAATLFMAVFVTAFSVFTDSLRDALDPKLR